MSSSAALWLSIVLGAAAQVFSTGSNSQWQIRESRFLLFIAAFPLGVVMGNLFRIRHRIVADRALPH